MSIQWRRIIVFGDQAIDRDFVVKLTGASQTNPFDPSDSCFTSNTYRVAADDQTFLLYYHVTSIPSSRMGRSSLQAPDILKKLYGLIRQFNHVHLLIYLVRADKPTSSNFRIFYDYLCQQDTPIILVQTTQTPSELSWFDLVLTLDGADPESDKVNLHTAITKHLNKNPKFISYTDRFRSTARGCWKLMAKDASWSLAGFRDALKLTYKVDRWLTEEEVDAICERIIEPFQISLKKQSAIEQFSVGVDIQQRADAILSTIIAVGNATPIPFLSVATECIEDIVDIVQVCAITIDLLS